MSHFQKVSIDDLQAGMFVEAVVRQKGNLKITSQGTIKSNSVVQWLKDKGILEVVVDINKCVRHNHNSVANDVINSSDDLPSEAAQKAREESPSYVGVGAHCIEETGGTPGQEAQTQTRR